MNPLAERFWADRGNAALEHYGDESYAVRRYRRLSGITILCNAMWVVPRKIWFESGFRPCAGAEAFFVVKMQKPHKFEYAHEHDSCKM